MSRKIAICFIIMACFLILASCAAQPPASAQEQAIPTVTPFPGPVATLQAAQDRINQAQSDKARADDLAQQAAQQASQARAAINAAQSAYNAAQQAITAQQVAVANDLIGQGNSKVQGALSQIDQLAQTVDQHQALFEQWSAERISDTIAIRDLTRDKAQISAAYNVVAAQLQTLQAAPKPQPQTIDTSWLLVAFGFMAILLIVAVYAISRRGAAPQPTIATMPPFEIIDEDAEQNRSEQ